MDEKTKVLENLLEIMKAELSSFLEMAEIHGVPKELSEKQIDNYLDDISKIMAEIEKLKNK